jgi:hypothetical protein
VRTTVTLDPDTRLLIERAMKERGLSFKQALNEAIRAGLAPPAESEPFTRPRDLGPPQLDLTHALRIAGELEDDAMAREISEGR